MQYHLYSSANNIREQEEREREKERERRDQELRRLASAGVDQQCFDLQRRLFAGQHPSFQDPNPGGPNPGSLPPPMMHNPSSPNPAGLASIMGFPPNGDGRDLFNERMSQSDALFRLQMGQCPDLSQAHAALAALGHFGGPHDGPGGPSGLGGVPPPHSQADAMNPLNFPGAPGVRPMIPGRDQFFNPQRYAPYGAAPYGAPSPFFGLGGPHAP